MGVLMKEYAGYMAIALIGRSFLQIRLTKLCIQFGLKGGHFSRLFLREYVWDTDLRCCSSDSRGTVMLYLRRRL